MQNEGVTHEHDPQRVSSDVLDSSPLAVRRAKMLLNGGSHLPCLATAKLRRGQDSHDEQRNYRGPEHRACNRATRRALREPHEPRVPPPERPLVFPF